MRARLLAILCALGLALPGDAAEATTRQTNLAFVSNALVEAKAKHGGNANVMLRRGLIANRSTHEIRILAEATGISASDPLEFFLIAEDSGHDYEALAVSFASAIDVDAALKFIGMTPGRPTHYDAMQLWPKGERVHMRFDVGEGDAARSYDAEDLVVDDRRESAMPRAGFIYTGSRLMPNPDGTDTQVPSAGYREPFAIAANYNEATSLLDVPRQATKGQEYQHFSANEEYAFEKGTRVDVVLTPEHTDRTRRVIEYRLSVNAKEKQPKELDDLAFALFLAGSDEALHVARDDAFAQFKNDAKAARDAYVQVQFGTQVPVSLVRRVYADLIALEGPAGIRLESPAEGQLFHKAFFGGEAFRDRSTRPSQPWELHLRAGNTGLVGKLALVNEVWNRDSKRFDRSVHEHEAGTASAALIHITAYETALQDTKRFIPPVLLVFAPADAPYGDVLDYLAPLMKTHGIVYVYL